MVFRAKKARETLLAHESNIRMFQELTRIHCEIDIDVALEDLAITPGKPELLASFCEEMKFGKRITERLLAVTGRG